VLWSFDTETHLSQPGLAAPPIVCGSVADDRVVEILGRTETLRWLRDRLAARDEIVGCNLVYDLGVVCAADPTLIDPVFARSSPVACATSRSARRCIDIARGNLIDKGEELGIRYGMRELSKRYLNEDITEEKTGPDSWRRRYATLEDTPIEQWPWAAKRYVLRDAAKPREIYLAQERWVGRTCTTSSARCAPHGRCT
jgi:DNA polymerase-1